MVEEADGTIRKYYPAETVQAKPKPKSKARRENSSNLMVEQQNAEGSGLREQVELLTKPCRVILHNWTKAEIAFKVNEMPTPNQSNTPASISDPDINSLVKLFSRDWYSDEQKEEAAKSYDIIDDVIAMFDRIKFILYEAGMLSDALNSVIPIMIQSELDRSLTGFGFSREFQITSTFGMRQFNFVWRDIET